jgi:predicted transglutaminase-like cysteine proteinase
VNKFRRNFNVWVRVIVISVLAIVCSRILADGELVFSEMLYQRIDKVYGSKAKERVASWQRVLNSAKQLDEDEKLYEINRFFNELPFVDDSQHWNKSDYWATPVEFLASNGGDCEDFTIAKYFSLRALGVPEEKMRFMYVNALRLNQAHMVLAYFPKPNAVPIVLDNINPRILPASQRRDLVPIYSFNGDGLWLAKAQGRGKQIKNSPNHSLWEDLTTRMETGF